MSERLQTGSRRTAPCPTCGKRVAGDAAAFPFCNERCKAIDLGRWLDESYRVSRPIEQSDIDEEV
ncbi:MAG: DNA gyrase inhibitor YacG [Planctomycetota bacterium]